MIILKKLTKNRLNETLPKIEKGIRKYCWIQDKFLRYNVSKDQEFQTRYNDFYKVRRNAIWRAYYYELLEMAKVQGITFTRALHILRERTGRIEASFASKLVATIYTNKPVMDRFVLDNFGLRLPYQYTSNRESKTIQIYNQLCQEYEELMTLPIVDTVCAKFNQLYPWVNISDLKKVDLMLWQIRD